MADKDTITLCLPTARDEQAVMVYRERFLAEGDSLDGTSRLDQYPVYAEWLANVRRNHEGVGLDEWHVQSTTLLAKRDDGALVGMMDIRHRLNSVLEKRGGHIGYCVCPDQRGKGYATQMLRQALTLCREMGLKRVMLTCDSGNIASQKVMIQNGARLDDQLPCSPQMMRYWIEL